MAMEQCNKEWEDYSFDRVDKHGNLMAESDYKDYYCDGWKAALEWVKSHSEVAKSLYMINVNDINDELGVN